MNKKEKIYKLIRNICLILFVAIVVPFFYQNYNKIITYNQITIIISSIIINSITILIPGYLLWKNKEEYSITRIFLTLGAISIILGSITMLIIQNQQIEKIAIQGIIASISWCLGYILLRGGAVIFGLIFIFTSFYQIHKLFQLFF